MAPTRKDRAAILPACRSEARPAARARRHVASFSAAAALRGLLSVGGMASRCPGAASAVAGTAEESLRCPFLASAAAQRYAVLPGGAGSGRPLFAGVASFAEALLAAHGPRGALPLPTCAPAAAEAAGCPFAKALRAQEAAAPPVAAAAAAAAPVACGAAVAPVCVAPLTAALARLPLATISFPRNGGPIAVRRRVLRFRLCPALTRAAVDSPEPARFRSARGSLPRRSRLRRRRRSRAPALPLLRACRQPRRVATHRSASLTALVGLAAPCPRR